MANSTLSIDQKIEMGIYPNYDQMYNIYITQNKSRAEICNLYSFSTTTFAAIIKKLGIQKDENKKLELRQKTNLEKYNTTCSLKNDKVQQKRRQTMIQKYGVEYASQSSNIIEKRKQTCLQKFGTVCNLQNDNCKKKTVETCLKRYGVDNAIKNPDIREKARQTVLSKYGVNVPLQSKEIYQKMIKTTKDRYGVEHPMQSEDIRKKTKDTCLSIYGTDNPMKNKNIKQKVINTNLENCQRDYVCQQFIDHYDIWSDDKKFIQFLANYSSKPTIEDLCTFFNVTNTPVLEKIHKCECEDFIHWFPGYNKSHFEDEIINFLKQSLKIKNILSNRRDIVDGNEIDIYLPDYKIGIEFNGTYWHSLLKLNDKKYHYNKSLKAQEKGIRLIHIYEYEWNDPVKQEIIKSLFSIALKKTSHRIYARKCEIKNISNKEAKLFNDINHLQGHRDAQITYGLYYKNQLVQLMSFSKTRYNRNLKNDNSWEIIRGCPGSNNVVVGGVSKIFKHFIKEHDPNMIFSYCDFNKFDGKGYEAIGMKFAGYTGPDMKWVMPDMTIAERSPSKHKELKEKARTQIWGAGSKKYIWNKNNN